MVEVSLNVLPPYSADNSKRGGFGNCFEATVQLHLWHVDMPALWSDPKNIRYDLLARLGLANEVLSLWRHGSWAR